MTRSTMAISNFMSHPVLSIDCHWSLAEALELMAQNHVRHLVVVDGDRAIGVLSERDVFRWKASRPTVDVEALPVHEAMSPEPTTVPSTDSLAHVAAEMARQQIGAVLVMDGARTAGIFTTSDALRALVTLAERPAPP